MGFSIPALLSLGYAYGFQFTFTDATPFEREMQRAELKNIANMLAGISDSWYRALRLRLARFADLY